jgi:hypothetical protein
MQKYYCGSSTGGEFFNAQQNMPNNQIGSNHFLLNSQLNQYVGHNGYLQYCNE